MGSGKQVSMDMKGKASAINMKQIDTSVNKLQVSPSIPGQTSQMQPTNPTVSKDLKHVKAPLPNQFEELQFVNYNAVVSGDKQNTTGRRKENKTVFQAFNKISDLQNDSLGSTIQKIDVNSAEGNMRYHQEDEDDNTSRNLIRSGNAQRTIEKTSTLSSGKDSSKQIRNSSLGSKNLNYQQQKTTAPQRNNKIMDVSNYLIPQTHEDNQSSQSRHIRKHSTENKSRTNSRLESQEGSRSRKKKKSKKRLGQHTVSLRKESKMPPSGLNKKISNVSKFQNTSKSGISVRNGIEENNDQYLDTQNHDGEIGFEILDQSLTLKKLSIPDPNANKIVLQKELGHYIVDENHHTNHHQHQEIEAGLNDSFYRIVDQDSIEVIDQHYDRCPLLKLRKSIMRVRVYIARFSLTVIQHSVFETISILIIVANCFFLALDDPTSSDPSPIMDMSDYIFQALYTIEMLFKIFGLGFIYNKGSYLRDAWNILDFVIVVSGYATFMLGSGGSTNISALRSFRVLRPLRTISGIEGLRVIVSALISSIPLLRDTILVLCFFFFIFAIAGVQLFQGALKNRCVELETGRLSPLALENDICGAANPCDPKGTPEDEQIYFCGKTNINPDYGVTNFDNILYSLLNVFVTVTLEGWSAFEIGLWQNMGQWVVAFFVPIIFIGTWFLLNLTLAVIKSKFSENHQQRKAAGGGKKKKKHKKKTQHSSDEETEQADGGPNDGPKKQEEVGDKQVAPGEVDNVQQRKFKKERERFQSFLQRVDVTMKQKEVSCKMITPRFGYHSKNASTDTMASKIGGAAGHPFQSLNLLTLLQNAQITKNNPKGIVNDQQPGHMSKKSQSMLPQFGPVIGNNTTISQSPNRKGFYVDLFNSKISKVAEETMDPGRPILPIFEERLSQRPTERENEIRNMKLGLGAFLNQKNVFQKSSIGQKRSSVMQSSDRFEKIPQVREESNDAIIQENHSQLIRSHQKELIRSQIMSHKPILAEKIPQIKKNMNPFLIEKDSKLFQLTKPSLNGSIKMHGLATINARGYDENRNYGRKQSLPMDDSIKKDVYDQIALGMDIFEFMDQEQLSSQNDYDKSFEIQYMEVPDSQTSTFRDIRFKKIQENELSLEDIDNLVDSSEITSKDKLLGRKTTGDTMKSFTKKLDEMSPKIDDSSRSYIQNGSNIKYPVIRRIKTYAEYHDGYQAEEEKKKKDSVKKQKGFFSIKEKARSFFNIKKEKLDVIQLSRSMPRQSIGQRLATNIVAPAFFSKMSIRAKSQALSSKRVMENQLRFKLREETIRRKRNKFFAPSIRNIGKTKEEILKEKSQLVKDKRVIKLGGGFEAPIDPRDLKTKKSLVRSASFNGKIQKKRTQVTNYAKDGLNGTIHQNKETELNYSFMSDDYWKELNQIKPKKNLIKIEEIKKVHEEINDSSIDMEAVLKKTKKKIVLKNKKYKFSSQQDVLQLRQNVNQGKLETKVAQENLDKLLDIQNELQKERESHQNFIKHQQQLKKIEKERKFNQNKHDYNPYQKKILYIPRQNFQELIDEEARDSDDNIETIMKRIEDDYNRPHRSNIHVTGTLSVVINDDQNYKKITNQTYFDNIDEKNYPTLTLQQIDQPQVSGFNHNSRENIVGQYREESNVSFISEKFKSQESQRNAPSDKKNHLAKSLLMNKYASSPLIRKLERRQTTKNFKTLRTLKTMALDPTNKGQGQQSIPVEIAKKPQILTDKQVLKRLNHEFKKSQVFNDIKQIAKLPTEIKRNDKDVQNVKTKKAKKQAKKPNVGGKPTTTNANDESSDTSEDDKDNESDYFVDREIIGIQEVTHAKKEGNGKSIDTVEWSGQDIIPRYDPYKSRIAIAQIGQIRIWPSGIEGYVKRFRVMLKGIMRGAVVDNFLILCVAMNTTILAIDKYVEKDKENPDSTQNYVLGLMNTVFTSIFAIEMGSKIIALGVVKYLSDRMNYLDGGVVILSMVELAFSSGKGALSAFRVIRIFRTFRVLRVARLLRSMKSMMNIIAVIQRSITSFMYLALLLFLFIFIYSLLGMQLFGGQMNFEDGIPRQNFNSFNQAFVTSFIILTMENWNTTMINLMRTGTHFIIVQLYCISWIFIGNYMLLNLFLSILLDSFTSVEEEDHDTPQKKLEKEKRQKEELLKKTGEAMIIEMQKMNSKSNNAQNGKKKKKRKSKANKQKQDENMLDESIELDLETLAIKKEESSKKEVILFDGIYCEVAWFLFSKTNPIRVFFYKLSTHGKFETVVLVAIVLSSFKLVFDTYILDLPPSDMRVVVSEKLDFVFTAFFTMESITKSLSQGFFMHRNTYLRETWNQLDFFIVVTSLIDVSFSNVNIPIIKILRLLRILRPLRFISHNSSMKTIVIALLQSMGAIINVGIVVGLIYMMFAILSVNLFGGKLYYCSVNINHVKNKRECLQQGGEWLKYDQNFDSVPYAMLTLFIVANQEGWPDILNTVVDSTGQETGPRYNSSPASAYFFVAFVFIGSFFLMNLFVGVIFMNFEAAQRDEAEALLLDRKEAGWVDMMKMIISTRPEIIKTPKNKISQWVYNFTKGETKFDFFIMMCIICNMLLMAINYEGQPMVYTKALERLNYFFTGVFAIEATLKIIGQGISYFSQTWNKFDFFVVTASFIDIVMGNLQGNSLKFLRVGPQLARVLRVLRVSRLFRLLNKYRGLQALLQTIMFSLPSLLNVLALLFLVFFIFAVLGNSLFKNIQEGDIINEYMNFKNFGNAMIILFRMSTGENWPTIMFDCMRNYPGCEKTKSCGQTFAPLFFILFVMICTYVMLNLFILIILQQFELYYLPDDNILQKFRDNLEQFKITWNFYAKEYEGIKIRQKDLTLFFKHLKGDLGFEGGTDTSIMIYLIKMNIESDIEGFVYFNELLFKTMKRKYGCEKTKKRVLAEFEFKTLEKLVEIKEKMIKKSRQAERFKVGSVNPFLAVMDKSMSFKAWVKIFKNNWEKRKEEQENDIERESSEENEENNTVIAADIYETVDDQSIHDEVLTSKNQEPSHSESSNEDEEGDSNSIFEDYSQDQKEDEEDHQEQSLRETEGNNNEFEEKDDKILDQNQEGNEIIFGDPNIKDLKTGGFKLNFNQMKQESNKHLMSQNSNSPLIGK